MRFKNRHFLKDRVGETREVVKFLWWPRVCKSGITYWLERVTVIEEVKEELDVSVIEGTATYKYKWVETEIKLSPKPKPTKTPLLLKWFNDVKGK